jgi:hypothetical protein
MLNQNIVSKAARLTRTGQWSRRPRSCSACPRISLASPTSPIAGFPLRRMAAPTPDSKLPA